MLSYRHAFHAGNKADIFKHSVLTLLVSHFKQKETPFTYVDTHAGCGLYNLQDAWALKTGEAKEGIETFIKCVDINTAPEVLVPYIELCINLFKKNEYAGSPELVRHLSREQDSLILSELQKADYDTLNYITKKDVRIHVHNRNGFEMLKALPFPQRTLVLIDPSYETDDDYSKVSAAVRVFNRKCSTAVVAVWYPLVNRRDQETETLKRELSEIVELEEKFTVVEHCFSKQSDNSFGMYGSGMAIINPPWLYAKEIDNIMQFLIPNL